MKNKIKQFPKLDNITPIPIPFDVVENLLTANIYALGREDITLIDAGPGIPGAIDFIKEVFKIEGLRFNNIRRIILTHGHMDHFGLASTIRKELNHPIDIYIHPEDMWKVTTEFFENETWSDEMDWLQKLAGIPDNDLAKMKKRIRSYYSIARPLIDLTPMEDNDMFSGDGYNLRVVYTPGHAPGLCCLYETGQRVLFCSDHILKNITPNPIIPLSRKKLRNRKYKSLIAYEESLEKISELDIKYLFPGHGEWIEKVDNIIDQYREHRSQRMEIVWEAAKKKELPLYNLVKDVFPNAGKGDLFLALSEIISTLEMLAYKCRAEIIDQGPPVIYRAL